METNSKVKVQQKKQKKVTKSTTNTSTTEGGSAGQTPKKKNKVTKLTKKQKEATARYRDEGIAMGFRFGTVLDEAEARHWTDLARGEGGMKPAKEFYVFDSPFQAIKEMGKEGLTAHNAVYGNFDISWLNLYRFWRDEVGMTEEVAPLNPMIKLAEFVNWMWFDETRTVVCRQPKFIALTNRTSECTDIHGDRINFACPVPHNLHGKALTYPDGEGTYIVEGTPIYDEYAISLIEKPAPDLTVQDVLAIKNTEVRSLLMKKVDPTKLSTMGDVIHARTLEGGGPYELHKIEFNTEIENDFRVYLKGECPSKGEMFFERVPDDTTTIDQALWWREDFALGRITGNQLRPEDELFVEPVVRT